MVNAFLNGKYEILITVKAGGTIAMDGENFPAIFDTLQVVPKVVVQVILFKILLCFCFAGIKELFERENRVRLTGAVSTLNPDGKLLLSVEDADRILDKAHKGIMRKELLPHLRFGVNNGLIYGRKIVGIDVEIVSVLFQYRHSVCPPYSSARTSADVLSGFKVMLSRSSVKLAVMKSG